MIIQANKPRPHQLCWLMALLLFFTLPAQGVENASKADEQAFYALSSMRFHVHDMDTNKEISVPSITFDDAEVNHLWATIANTAPASYQTALELAKSYYYAALEKNTYSISAAKLLAKTAHILDQTWQDLSIPPACKHSAAHLASRRLLKDFDHHNKKKINPYLLPENHPMTAPLNAIFMVYQVLDDLNTFIQAGFIPLYYNEPSAFVVARHPLLPGYIVKAYLDSQQQLKDDLTGFEKLAARCKGAANVRHLITKKNLHHFSVPDKWIYPLANRQPPPVTSAKAEENISRADRQTIILLETDMQLVSHAESQYVWKNIVTTEILDELYCILSHGFASCNLPLNIPYTISGKFACIDTEYPQRIMKYSDIQPYLSDEMYHYWTKLVKNGGPSS